MVRNDVRIAGDLRVLIVSGSNMSGKSTLLRTVGINAVLAQAGAPVRARRLRLTTLEIGASIRIQDSLQSGVSRFYAEITRLGLIMRRAAETRRVLFLIDELLHGTNSHDRRIGAEAIVRGLVERGAIGLVTTHDLALAAVATAMGSQWRQRALPGRAAGRPAALRLPHAAGRRRAQQRAGADAIGGARRVSAGRAGAGNSGILRQPATPSVHHSGMG